MVKKPRLKSLLKRKNNFLNLASIGINRNLILKAGINNVKTGDFLYIKVLSHINDKARISVNGKILTVNSSLLLKSGQTLRVKAVWNGNLLELRPAEQPAAAKMPALLNGYFKSDTEGAVVFAAMKNAGLSLKDENIKNMVKILSRLKKADPGKARIAAELLKKGFIADENAVSYIEGNSAEDNHKKNNNFHELFNSVEADDINWLILPYSLKGPERMLKGSLKLKFRKSVKLPDTAVLEVMLDTERLFFVIDNPCRDNRKIEIYTSQEGRLLKKTEIRNELEENLRNLGIKIDDNINNWCFDKGIFDGFGPTENSAASGFEELA